MMGLPPPPPPPLLWGLVLLWGLWGSPAGCFVLHLESDCLLSGGPSARVLGSNWTLAFNKMPLVCFVEEAGRFLPCGLGASFPWNYTAEPIAHWLDTAAPPQGQAAQKHCQGQLRGLWGPALGRRTPPKVHIHRVTPQNTPWPTMLACTAWGFYPPEVAITWLWNGARMDDHAGPLALSNNGDWTFQARRTLPVDPRRGGVYSCRVDHASLTEPIVQEWVPGLALEMRLKVGLAAAVFAVGAIFLAVAVVVWRKRAPAGYVPIDGSSYPEGH